MHKAMALVAVIAFLGGCAAIPNVTVSYYPPKATTSLTVTQTIDCDQDKAHVFVGTSVQPLTAYSSDRSGPPHTFQIQKLDGAFADSSTVFALTDDGRLKSVNAESTGQGEAIFKSAITLVGAITALGEKQPIVTRPACAVVAAWGKGKPVSLIYARLIDFSNGLNAGDSPIDPTPDSRALYDQLKDDVPETKVVLRAGTPAAFVRVADYKGPGTDFVPLTLNETASVNLQVLSSDHSIWTQDVSIPQAKTYDLPIPKSAWFGKQTFALVLSDAGTVTSVTYAKQAGIGGALNVANAGATALKPETAADQAAQAKAQADLIAQQQRLVRCRANPSACT